MQNGMSTAPMRAAARSCLLTVTSLWGCVHLGACGPDEDTIVPAVQQTRPADGELWPADRPLTVAFDAWLDPDTVRDDVVVLSSGEQAVAVWVEYDPVGRAVRVYPFIGLSPGLGYSLAIDPSRLRALGGDAGGEVVEVGFRAGPAEGYVPPPTPSDAEMADLFAERCGCHGPEPSAFPALTREAMLGVPSRRLPERLLVDPGRPLESLLVLRVLEGYPGVRGMQKSLSDEERRRIVRWVAGM